MNAMTQIPRPYLTVEEVADRFNVSTDSIRRWIRQGRFPKPLRVGTGASRWRLSDIEAYEASLTTAYFVERLALVPDFLLPAAE